MKAPFKALFLVLTLGICACTRQAQQKSTEDKTVVQDVAVKEVEEDPTPPPTDKINGFSLPSETLQQWLAHLSAKEKPAKKISTYSFMLYQSADENILTVVGRNRDENNHYSYNRIDFQPTRKWLLLSQKEYRKLTYAQIREKLVSQLNAFTQTDQFKTSFFKNADSIDLNGEVIWRKQ